MKVLLSLIQIDLELYMYLFSYFLMKEIKSDGLFWGSGLWLMIEPAQVTAALRSITGTTKQAFTGY